VTVGWVVTAALAGGGEVEPTFGRRASVSRNDTAGLHSRAGVPEIAEVHRFLACWS
jgi:hypothetical protein